jgi:hypothetical protein
MDLPDTLPPPTDRTTLEPTLRDVYEAQQAMGHQLSDLTAAVAAMPGALRNIASLLVEHYEREARRNDAQDRRLDEVERRLAALEST